jgi:hypothetical protein
MSVFDESMSRRSFAKTTAAVSAGAALGVPSVKAAVAQDATPVGSPAEGGPGLPPLPEGATVVAEGLWNPRFLVFGDDGTLYVTENGVGGDEVLTPPDAGATPVDSATPVPGAAESTPEAPPMPPSTRGYTGQVSAVAPDGTVTVLASGLASYSDGIGPVGITLVDGQIYFSIGGAAVGIGFPPLPEENTINRINAETGEVEIVAELGPYEEANNPDGTDVNPNLYAITTSADGQVLVVDAGGNTVYTVDPATGEFSLTAIVPSLEELTGAEPDPDMGPRHPVPTGITIGGGGNRVQVRVDIRAVRHHDRWRWHALCRPAERVLARGCAVDPGAAAGWHVRPGSRAAVVQRRHHLWPRRVHLCQRTLRLRVTGVRAGTGPRGARYRRRPRAGGRGRDDAAWCGL